MDIQVIKRDGSTEPFDEQKIERVVTAAGLSPQEAQELGQRVTAWLGKQKTTVTTRQIRDQVVGELKMVNTYAANLFVWYERTKDTSASGPT